MQFHDRLGAPRPEALALIGTGQSHCQHALRDGAFLTDDAAFDRRLAPLVLLPSGR